MTAGEYVIIRVLYHDVIRMMKLCHYITNYQKVFRRQQKGVPKRFILVLVGLV